MSVVLRFVAGLASTLLAGAVGVGYLRRPLKKILTDVCGSQDRAEFWTAFSVLTVSATPVIFALTYQPTAEAPALVEIAAQLKWGLIGLVISLLVLRWVICRFLRRQQPKP